MQIQLEIYLPGLTVAPISLYPVKIRGRKVGYINTILEEIGDWTFWCLVDLTEDGENFLFSE